MKRLSIALLSCTVLLVSCKKEEEKPKVIYDTINKEKNI
jgi:hypothetical protein